MSKIQARLEKLGISLPAAPKPVASYVPVMRTGNQLYISGQVAFRDGALIHAGLVPAQVSLEQAQDCARQCALNGLAWIADALDGDLDRVKQIVKLGVFVASEPTFTDQPKVANGASELMFEIFGEAGRHSRSAVGATSLPVNSPVEIEMIVEID